MVNISSQEKKINIKIQSGGIQANVGVTQDTAQFYSEKAREWAISNRIVDGVDYSSKYYAGRANQSALNAQSFAQSALETLNNVDNKVQEATDNIETQKQDTIAEIQDIATNQKEEIENLSEQEQSKIVDLGIDTRANVDLGNLSSLGEKHFLNKSQITNCLLEVPQRIKYTLEDGTLTIKAGSVVIVPYGTEDLTADYPVGSTFLNDNFKAVDTQFVDGKFFVWIEVQNDVSTTGVGTFSNNNSYVYILVDNTIGASSNESTTTVDSWVSGGGIQYNTTTNYIAEYTTSAQPYRSFPILKGARNNGVFTSIDQVFNGMGYIGSTLWVDKGVKGLIPNGRNEDGTLRNIEYETSTIATQTLEGEATGPFTLNVWSNGIVAGTTAKYDSTLNKIIGSSRGTSCFEAGQVYSTNGVITSFNPKQPFRAIDYSDSSEVSGWAMPSDEGINLTLGASGTQYTAPANGWVALSKHSFQYQYIRLVTVYGFEQIDIGISVEKDLYLTLPVSKGTKFMVEYSASGATRYFKFYYAQGDK